MRVSNLSTMDRDLIRSMRGRGWTADAVRVILADRHREPRFHKYLIRRFTNWKKARFQTRSCKKMPIPPELRWEVWERDNFTCQHCGARRFLAVDHVFPESLGGEMTAENLQTLCKSCNSKKGARVDG